MLWQKGSKKRARFFFFFLALAGENRGQMSCILDVKVSTRRNLLATASSFLFEGGIFSVLKLGGKLDKCPENGRKPQKLGSSGSAFPLDNPKKGKTLISSIFRRISRRMKVKVTSKRKFTRKAGSAAKTEGPMAESSRPSAPTSGTETSGKAGAGPLGKAASAGTEATAAVVAVTSVTAVTSAPAAAVTAVTSAVPGPKGPVAGPSGAAGSGTTPEDNRPVCFKCGAKGHYRTNCPGKKDTKTKIQMPRECCLETIHLVIMNESLGKAASAGTEATAAVAAVTSVTAVTSAPAVAVTAVTAVTSAVPGPKGPVARPSGVVGSGTTPEDNRPVKILLNLRRQFTAYKGNVLNYCMPVKRIKFNLIRIKAWALGSWLIERLNSLQACRTSRSCGRVRQVDYPVFRKIASWNWEGNH